MNTINHSTYICWHHRQRHVTVETRNLAVFLLRAPGDNQIARMEIFPDLERKREYSSYPVYWLGR